MSTIVDAVTRQDMAAFLRDNPSYYVVSDRDLPVLPPPSEGIGWEAAMLGALGGRRR